uniref:Uncharacterized protein n=1 Tax=Fundulus heteroclitus TaxID=8078 RepID=A0A3Q2PA05_FUNHE
SSCPSSCSGWRSTSSCRSDLCAAANVGFICPLILTPFSFPFNRESRFFTDQFRSCWWESCEYRRLQGHISLNSFHSVLLVTLYFSSISFKSLIFMVPAACSLFPQRCTMAVSKLEPELRDSIVSQYGDKVQLVYFNKGL